MAMQIDDVKENKSESSRVPVFALWGLAAVNSVQQKELSFFLPNIVENEIASHAVVQHLLI